MELEHQEPGGGLTVKRAFFAKLLVTVAFACGATAPLAQASIEHVGDFETGDLSQWPGSSGLPNLFFLCCDHSAEIITANPAPRAGRYALKIERRKYDALIADKWNRAEIVRNGFPDKNYTERWVGMSIYVPNDFPFSEFTNWHTVAQYHSTGTKGSTVASLKVLSNKRWRIGYRTQWPDLPDTPPPFQILYDEADSVETGKWTDFVWHIIWNPNPAGNGLFHVWKDGVKIVNYNGPIGFNTSNAAYFKMGTYSKASEAVTRILFFDEVRFGDETSSMAAVKPGGNAAPPAVPPPGVIEPPVAPPPPPPGPIPVLDPHVSPDPPSELVIVP